MRSVLTHDILVKLSMDSLIYTHENPRISMRICKDHGHLEPGLQPRIRLLDPSIELKLMGMFGYMGHCVVSIFEAIRQPVYKII